MIDQVFDGHCHLAALSAKSMDFPRAVAAITPRDFKALVCYRREKPQTKVGFGLHPWFVGEYPKLNELEQLLCEQIELYQPDFIGECGLDFLKADQDYQQEVLLLHFQLANQYKLPVVVHCVRAYNQLLTMLTGYKLQSSLLLHAFNGNTELARQLTKKGAFLGVGSIIMKSDSQLVKSISRISMAHLLIESDAPYMPIPPKNFSSSLDCKTYLQELSRLLNLEYEELKLIVNQNWNTVFRPNITY